MLSNLSVTFFVVVTHEQGDGESLFNQSTEVLFNPKQANSYRVFSLFFHFMTHCNQH